MQLPVWVTVVIARFVGGLAVGLVAGVLVAASVLSNTSPDGGLPRSSAITLTLAVTLICALVTGGITAALLPALSACRVGIGTALLACCVGQVIPFVGGLLLYHAVTGSPQGSMYMPLYGTAGPFVSLGLTVAGIAATTWMIQSSTIIGSGHGPRYELYGKARRESLDDEY